MQFNHRSFTNKLSRILAGLAIAAIVGGYNYFTGASNENNQIKLAPDVTLLVAHNIDLAPRAPVKEGETVKIQGRYEWNNRGGVLHWTHHDPKGKKQGGWIYVNGRYYK